MVCAAGPPQCLRDDVLRNADRVTPDAIGGGYDFRCPNHDDTKPSAHIEPGSKVRFVWHCRAGCESWEVRDALISSLKVRAECLGSYGRSQYRIQGEGDSAKLRQISTYLARGRPSRAGELRLGIRAIIDGGEIPASKDDFLAFAELAGVCRTDAYRLLARYAPVSSGLAQTSGATAERSTYQHSRSPVNSAGHR